LSSSQTVFEDGGKNVAMRTSVGCGAEKGRRQRTSGQRRDDPMTGKPGNKEKSQGDERKTRRGRRFVAEEEGGTHNAWRRRRAGNFESKMSTLGGR